MIIYAEIACTDDELSINKWRVKWQLADQCGTFTAILDKSCDEQEVSEYFERRAELMSKRQ